MQQKAITGPSYIIRIALSQNSDEVDDNADKGQPHGAEVEYAHQRLTLIKFVCTENAEQQTHPKQDPLVAKLSACYGSVGIGVCIRVCVDIAVGVVYQDLRLLLLLSDFLDLPTAGSADDGVGCDHRPAMLTKLCYYVFNKTSDNRNNICGKNVAAFRKEMHISQRELADWLRLIGLIIDKNAIQRIESGQRFVTDIELCALSRVFGRSYSELLSSDHSDTE